MVMTIAIIFTLLLNAIFQKVWLIDVKVATVFLYQKIYQILSHSLNSFETYRALQETAIRTLVDRILMV